MREQHAGLGPSPAHAHDDAFTRAIERERCIRHPARDRGGRADVEYNPARMAGERLRWGRILLGGFFAELGVFAVVFPVQYFFGQRAFLAAIVVASALLPLVFAVWVCRKVSNRFL